MRSFQIIQYVVLALSCLVLGVTLVTLLSWPAVGDAEVMRYISWRIWLGDVPYKDVIDMNWPGSYLPYLLAFSLGWDDAFLRSVDLVALMVTCFAIIWALREYDVLWRVAAALTFAVWHLQDVSFMLQRELMIVGGFIVAAGCLADVLKGARVRRMLIAGFALGASCTVKPLMLPIFLCFAILCRHVRSSERAAGFVWFAMGFIIPIVCMVAWLAWEGALTSFFTNGLPAARVHFSAPAPHVFSGYLALWPVRLGSVLLTAFLVWNISKELARGKASVDEAVWISLLWAGALAFVLQGKGAYYQLHPLLGALPCALVALGGNRSGTESRIIHSVLLGILLILSVTGFTHRNSALIEANGESGRKNLMTDIRSTCPPEGLVAYIGMNEVPAALYQLEWTAKASPLVFETNFLHNAEDSWARVARDSFRQDLRNASCLIVTENGWPIHGYDRIKKSFPDLADQISGEFVLVLESGGPDPSVVDGWRIYVRDEAVTSVQ